MQRQRKKLKVYREEAKERLTTHWDLDYMTTAELEAAMAAGQCHENAGSVAASGGLSRALNRVRWAFTLGLGKQV